MIMKTKFKGFNVIEIVFCLIVIIVLLLTSFNFENEIDNSCVVKIDTTPFDSCIHNCNTLTGDTILKAQQDCINENLNNITSQAQCNYVYDIDNYCFDQCISLM